MSPLQPPRAHAPGLEHVQCVCVCVSVGAGVGGGQTRGSCRASAHCWTRLTTFGTSDGRGRVSGPRVPWLRTSCFPVSPSWLGCSTEKFKTQATAGGPPSVGGAGVGVGPAQDYHWGPPLCSLTHVSQERVGGGGSLMGGQWVVGEGWHCGWGPTLAPGADR